MLCDASGNYIDGVAARKAVGLSSSKAAKLAVRKVPTGCSLFVQTTSANRKLGPGPLLIKAVCAASAPAPANTANHRYRILKAATTAKPEAVCKAHGVPFRMGECFLQPEQVRERARYLTRASHAPHTTHSL